MTWAGFAGPLSANDLGFVAGDRIIGGLIGDSKP